MKQLKDYIVESTQEVKSLWASKREAKEIQDKLQHFFVEYRDKVSLTNKSELGKFFKAFVEKLPYGNRMRNLTILKQYGMGTEQGFASVILGNKDEFDKRKWNTSCIKNFDLTAIEREHQKWKNSDDYVAGSKVEDAEEFDIVGKRGKSTEHHVNMCRVEFGKDNDVKYYDCYPILAKNYFGHLDEIKKRAQLGILDMQAYQEI